MEPLALCARTVGAVLFSLVVLASPAWAGDFEFGALGCEQDVRVKLGASGQTYLWRDGGC